MGIQVHAAGWYLDTSKFHTDKCYDLYPNNLPKG